MSIHRAFGADRADTYLTRLASCVLALALAAGIAFPGALAYSDELDDATARVEETTAAYNEAKDAYDALEAQIADTQAQIEQLEATLPDYRSKASASMVALYKSDNQTEILLQSLLGCHSLSELMAVSDGLDAIYDKNMGAIKTVKAKTAELEALTTQLNADSEIARAKLDEAETALKEAKKARTAAQREAYGAGAATSGAQTAGLPEIDWSMDEEEFIATWAPRIDDYMSGSPMSGYGETFAAMSWKYGVDPRWSPAISMIESGRGSVCFASHNAWGMISMGGFSSWEAGIEANCKLLGSSLYGGVLTMRAAQTYCNSEWYYAVLAQMQRI